MYFKYSLCLHVFFLCQGISCICPIDFVVYVLFCIVPNSVLFDVCLQCLVAAKDLLNVYDSEALYTEEVFPVATGGCVP